MAEKQGETKTATDIGLLRCRTCLQELDANSDLVDMFQCWVPPWKGMESTIAEDLAKLANIEIKYTDEYSKVICEPCCVKLQNACDFVYSVRMNDSILRQRKMDDSNNEVWPKPIQIDKNISNTVYNNVLEIEIKQELPDVEYTDSDRMEICRSNELATLEIKIEPEEFIQENQNIKDNQRAVVEIPEMHGQCFLHKTEATDIRQREIAKTCIQSPKEYGKRKRQSANKIPKTNAQRQQQFRQNQKKIQESETLDLKLARKKYDAERSKRYRDRLKLRKQRGELDLLLPSNEHPLPGPDLALVPPLGTITMSPH